MWQAKGRRDSEIYCKTNQQLKPMLTPDQVTAFDSLVQQQKQRYDAARQQVKDAAKKKS